MKFLHRVYRAFIPDPFDTPEWKERMRVAHEQDAKLTKHIRLVCDEGRRIEAERAAKQEPK